MFGLRVLITESTSPKVGKAVNGGGSPTFKVGTLHQNVWSRYVGQMPNKCEMNKNQSRTLK